MSSKYFVISNRFTYKPLLVTILKLTYIFCGKNKRGMPINYTFHKMVIDNRKCDNDCYTYLVTLVRS